MWTRFRLLLLVAIATIPIMVVGVLTKDLVTEYLRSTEIIAWTTLAFAVVLWAADRQPEAKREPAAMTGKDAVILGLLQCLALIPVSAGRASP